MAHTPVNQQLQEPMKEVKTKKITAKIDQTIKAKYNKLNKTIFSLSLIFLFNGLRGKTNKQTHKQKTIQRRLKKKDLKPIPPTGHTL